MELEMLEMAELPNQSIGDNRVARSETMEMSEVADLSNQNVWTKTD